MFTEEGTKSLPMLKKKASSLFLRYFFQFLMNANIKKIRFGAGFGYNTQMYGYIGECMGT
jgi:hypothetical protein